ncbi:histone-lysine N-methyltransferase 2A-like isoform X2 [Anguilla anguilla]|uniref:histone-lysine N-methyltransferase 2A-like isoform X2 n=1 Tax=Anguilla anguilla TaxID=7936 RepID=UPI0015B0E2DE|nr:histone-lysine N-methyltransferase 2A-like isoform X2 [Anguilla anguilla]
MAHSCRWRFPARPGGNSISGSWRRAGRVRVTAALRTVTDTHPNTNGLGLGFDAALQVSAAIGNNLQKFRAILGETSGSSSGEEEEFCGFGTIDEHRRKESSLRPPADKTPLEKKPRGRPRRSPVVPQLTSHEKPQESYRPQERPSGKANRSPERPLVSREKRRGRPPRSAQRGDAGAGEHQGGGQQASRGWVCGQNVSEGERERQWGAPRDRRFHRTKVKLKSSLRVVGRKGVAIPVAPRRKRGRPPSAERLRAGAPTPSGHQGPHVEVGPKQKTPGDLDPRTPQHLKLRTTQTTDATADPSSNRSPAPATLRRVLGVRQSPRLLKPPRIVPPSRRSDAAIAKQLLQRAKKGVAVRGCPGGAGRDRAMRRRWTQLKNIRQFRMPVVSTISMRVIKTPKRFIEDESGFRVPPPHAKMARLDAAPSASLPTAPASAITAAPAPAGTVVSIVSLAPPLTGPEFGSTVSQHSSRSSSPSLDSSSEAQSPPPPVHPPPPSSERGRMVTFGRGRRGRRKCLISPATGLLRSSSSQQASPAASSSSLPPLPLLAPPHPLQSSSPTSAVGEHHPHHHPAWVMPHPMASFLPPPPVLSPLQDQQRSILRQPTFRWSSALASRQCFSSAKYAKEGLIRKPVFDNFQPPPLTARDVGLLPPCAGVGVGAPFAAPSRGTAIGGFFPPLPAHHHLQPSSRFGVPLHKLRPPLHKLRPLLRAPRFTPSEAHSRIFESVTIPKPRSASLSELRAPSLIGQGVRRRRRGQPRSPSHSMTTRSSQSGAQAGKGPLQQGSSVASPLLTCALTSASFSTFTAQPTSLPAEPTIHRPSSTSSSSSLLMFASSLQLAGRGPGMGGKEKVSSLPQENLTKEKDTEERNEEENKREVEKECERRGMAVAAGGISGVVPCPLVAGGNATEDPPLCSTPKNGSVDTAEDPPTMGPGHRAFPETSPACPTLRVQLSKNDTAADGAEEEEEKVVEEEEGEEEEAEEEEDKEESVNPPSQQPPAPSLDPALAPEGRQQVAGMLKKGKAQPCKMEKSRPLKSTEPPKAQDFSDTPGRGPRIKHVCRRAAVALGRNRAVFPDDLPTLSALPWEERENILSSMGNDDKSSVAGSEEAERPVPPVRPAMRPRVVPDSPARAGRRSRRCGQCAGCQVPDDCGVCANCLDKPKFGGRNIKKQCCKERKCQNLQWMPAKMFLQKPGKVKKDKKEKQMFERKDCRQPVKTPPSEGNPKPVPLTLKEEPAHSETPPLKLSEEQQPQQPPSTPNPAAAPETKQRSPPLQQAPPPQSQLPPQPNQTPPQKGSVTSPSPTEPKEKPQQSNMGPPPTESASEVKLMRKLTPGFPLPDKNKAKEKEKQTPTSRSLNSLSTPSTGGAAAPRVPCDGVHGLPGEFKEDCDVENVWEAGGLSILTSVPVKPLTLCLLCASSGNVEFVFCQVCCEPFHLFCLGEAERPLQQQRENWCCRRCRFCQACGQQDPRSKQLLECEKCGNSYHPECLGPKHPRRPTKKNRVWICTRCVCCKSCGSTSPGKAADAQWSHDFSMCQDCAKLFVKGNFCPLCDKCYDDDDYESKMMQCGSCARWVHARCENLTDEMYEILSKLPESVVYTCTSCTRHPPAEWRTALEKELQSSVRRVLNALLNSRTSAHLLHCTPAVMKLSELNPKSEGSLPSRRSPEGPNPLLLRGAPHSNKSPPDLESVKTKMESGGYRSVLEFSDDVVKIIQTAISSDGGQPENKKANSMVKAFFSRQMERVFPWFQVKESRFWQPHKVSPSSELLPDAVLPPSLDHNYAQCQERDGSPPAEQSLLMKKIIPAPWPQTLGESDPPITPSPAPSQNLREDSPEVVPPPGLSDSRQCVLCLKFGDDNINDGGRLLYIGQNEWAHVNCALWSAEVFEDDDGTLKNVHTAVARGKQLRCELCKRSGASVCCCVSGCSSKFHFMCARRQRCVFLEDKRVYCPRHHNLSKGEVVSESGFGVARRILVDFEGVSLRRKFLSCADTESIQIMIGSMTVDCLGILTELSDFEHHLFPIGYQCSRVYWSTVDARRRCVYTFRILACGPLLGDPVSEMELSPQVDPVKSFSIPTTKPKANMRNGEHNQTLGQSPCCSPLPSPGALVDSHHGIVKVDDAPLSSGLQCSAQQCHTSSPSPYLSKQRVTSTVYGGGILSQLGTISTALSLSITPQHPGAKEVERERYPAVDSLSGETMTLIPRTQSKWRDGVPKKRENSRRAHDGKLPGPEHVVAGSLKERAALPPDTVVLTGLSKSSSCKLEKGEQCRRGTEGLPSPHSPATLPRSNLGKDTIRSNSANNASRGNSVKDTSRGNSVKDAIRSNLGKDTRRSKSEQDTSRGYSVQDASRNNSVKETSRSNSVKDARRNSSEKDGSRSNSVKDACRNSSKKDGSRSNSVKDARRNSSEKDGSRSNSVKGAHRNNSEKDDSRNNSVKDARRNNSEKDASRGNLVKDSSWGNSVKDASRSHSVKDATSGSNSEKDVSRNSSEKDANRGNSVKDTSRGNSVRDASRSNSVKDTSRSNSMKDASRSNSKKDTSRSNSVNDASGSNLVKDGSRNSSEKDASRSNLVKDGSRNSSEKDASRSNLVKDANRSKAEKDVSRGNSVKDTSRSNTVKEASRSSIVKHNSRSYSVESTNRSNSVKDTSCSYSVRSSSVNCARTNTSVKDPCRDNSTKDAGRSNSVKRASSSNRVKDTSSCNSGKDAGRSNSVKDTSRSNLVKDTNRSNSIKDSSRGISVKDASRSTSVKENSMSKSVKDAGRSNLMKDTSQHNPVKDMTSSNLVRDTIMSNLGKKRNSAQATAGTMKPGPQPQYHRAAVNISHGHLPGPASTASCKPLWSLEATAGDAVTHSASNSRERSSKVRATGSVTVRDGHRNREELTLKGESRSSGEAVVRERDKKNTAGIRSKASGTKGKEKHPDQAGSSSCDQRNCANVEELKLRCELERGLKASQVDTPKLGKELSPKERKQWDQVKTTHLRTDPNETHTVSTSCSTVTSPSCSSSAAAQSLHTRSSSLLVFSSTSTSPDSSESESERHLPAHHCEDDKDGPEEGEEDGSAADENQEDDSDESGSAKRRYPRRSARARSNTFFGLTPFYGVRSYGEEDVPFHCDGEACEQKRAGGRSSKLSPEGQVDRADNVCSSSSAESEEDEEGSSECPKKDAFYYNFTRTVLSPGIEQSVGRIPELHSFLKKEAGAKETKREEAGSSVKSLGQPRIGQLDGVDDGSESDASLSAAGMNTTSTTSTSTKTTRKKKAKEGRVEQDRPEKQDESSSSGCGNSGGRGNNGSRSRSRKNQKESSLSLGSGKSQGQGPLDAQLSLSTDLLKSDSDNTNSDDCGNILPSDIMEFVLNTPSMQALDQQPESSSSQLLSLDEGFSLDGNRGKDMSLFEDFPQQLPSTGSAERGASVPGDEPFLPLELPSDLSVLTTRSSSVTSQNPQPEQPEPSSHPIISLPTDDSTGEKVSNKTGGNIVANENQQGGLGGGDLQSVEGRITPGHIDANLIASPSTGEVMESANREVTDTSGTSGLQGLQKHNYVPTPAGSSGSTQVASTAVQPTHLKPGTENLIVVNQHLQPLYVLQTCPGVTQKIQIAPSVTTAAVIDTRSSLISSMTGGLTLTAGLHTGVPAPQSMFPPGSKGPIPISHHPQIHTFTGTAHTGCQPMPSASSSLLIGVHPNDPHILVSEAGQHPGLAPNSAIVSCNSSMPSSVQNKKRPISRLQPRRSRKLARAQSQPSNMTLINLSPMQITAGIPAQPELVELGALTSAAPAPHRKVPNIIKRPKSGVMYFEPPTLLSHGVSVSAAQPVVLGHEPPAQLLPCTVSGLNPNQSVLNVLSVPPGGTGSLLSTSALTTPISGLLLKASQQSMGLPDHQMILQSGTPIIPQLSNTTQTPVASSICVLPPTQLPSHQTLGISAAQQEAQHLQHRPAKKPQPPGHSTSVQNSVLLTSDRVSSQASQTKDISRTPDHPQACKTTSTAGTAPLSGKGKQKGKRTLHSSDEAGGKKAKACHADHPRERLGEPNKGSCSSSTSGWRDPVSHDPMDTEKLKEREVKRAEILQKNPKPTALDPHKEEGAKSSISERRLLFEICSDDGFQVCCETIEEAWKSLTDKVQEARSHVNLKELCFQGASGLRMLGLVHNAVIYFVEQLRGARHCRNHRFRFHKPEGMGDPPVNPHGSARVEQHHRKSLVDMFNFLASKHRHPPPYQHREEEAHPKSARRGSSVDLPLPMRLRRLKKASKKALGVYRSAIHGRGLFCRRNIDAGEMVIEYSGTVIRSVLAEKRQRYYEGKGVGSYMFRIDDYEVVDATMHGNAARFINHSCKPNCFSRVINIQGHKRIIIFALRNICRGEEITYDYKFPVEGPGHKLPCNCGTKTCRKFLN